VFYNNSVTNNLYTK